MELTVTMGTFTARESQVGYAATELDQSNQHVPFDSTRFFRDEKSVQTDANNFKAGHVLIQLNNSLDT